MSGNFAWRRLPILLSLVFLLTGCTSSSSEAAGATPPTDGKRLERSEVTQLIARYEVGAPPATSAGRPWGAQCVARSHRDTLANGRWIGARMRVIRIDPPVTPTVARVIALQMQQCPYIEWVEADVIRFTVP